MEDQERQIREERVDGRQICARVVFRENAAAERERAAGWMAQLIAPEQQVTCAE